MSNSGTTLAQRMTPSLERFDSQSDITFQSLHCMMPAIVQAVRYTDGGPIVDVVITVNTLDLQLDGDPNGPISLKTFSVTTAKLTDVPVSMIYLGGWNLTFPISVGDECMIVFADREIGVWLQNGGINNTPISDRMHSLSDAIAVPGLRSIPRALANYSQSSVQLRNDDGSVMIDLAAGRVTVTAPDVQVNCTTAEVTASDQITLDAMNGVIIDGHGQTKIDGHNFDAHVHTGITPGTFDTGPVA